jgi:hypothetical protein
LLLTPATYSLHSSRLKQLLAHMMISRLSIWFLNRMRSDFHHQLDM